jgi:flagellar hook-length control protein FliK
MAADAMLTVSGMPMPAAPPASAPAPTPATPARSSLPAGSGAGSGGGGPEASNASARARQGMQRASEPDSQTPGSSGDSTDSARSRPDPQNKAQPAPSDQSSAETSARPATRASGGSSAASAKAGTPAGAARDDFPATLAQSLAAAPAEGAAPAHAAAAKADSAAPSEPSNGKGSKDSVADPTQTALALMEHSLAGVLMGVPAPAVASATSSPTVAGVSAPTGHATPGSKSTAMALATQLATGLPTDAKGATPPAATAAGSPGTAGAATAALTAAQLTAGSHAGLLAKADPAPLSLSAPVGSGAWTEELGGKLTWMAHQGIQSASLQLSPEHLGPVQVSISVHNGQASVWFGAAQQDTRTALQQSLPQLRQLFANQGLNLADAGVSREPPRGHGQPNSARGTGTISAVAAAGTDGTPVRTRAIGGLGLIDTYA